MYGVRVYGMIRCSVYSIYAGSGVRCWRPNLPNRGRCSLMMAVTDLSWFKKHTQVKECRDIGYTVRIV